jgi:hypothetical protein
MTTDRIHHRTIGIKGSALNDRSLENHVAISIDVFGVEVLCQSDDTSRMSSNSSITGMSEERHVNKYIVIMKESTTQSGVNQHNKKFTHKHERDPNRIGITT